MTPHTHTHTQPAPLGPQIKDSRTRSLPVLHTTPLAPPCTYPHTAQATLRVPPRGHLHRPRPPQAAEAPAAAPVPPSPESCDQRSRVCLTHTLGAQEALTPRLCAPVPGAHHGTSAPRPLRRKSEFKSTRTVSRQSAAAHHPACTGQQAAEELPGHPRHPLLATYPTPPEARPAHDTRASQAVMPGVAQGAPGVGRSRPGSSGAVWEAWLCLAGAAHRTPGSYFQERAPSTRPQASTEARRLKDTESSGPRGRLLAASPAASCPGPQTARPQVLLGTASR